MEYLVVVDLNGRDLSWQQLGLGRGFTRGQTAGLTRYGL